MNLNKKKGDWTYELAEPNENDTKAVSQSPLIPKLGEDVVDELLTLHILPHRGMVKHLIVGGMTFLYSWHEPAVFIPIFGMLSPLHFLRRLSDAFIRIQTLVVLLRNLIVVDLQSSLQQPVANLGAHLREGFSLRSKDSEL